LAREVKVGRVDEEGEMEEPHAGTELLEEQQLSIEIPIDHKVDLVTEDEVPKPHGALHVLDLEHLHAAVLARTRQQQRLVARAHEEVEQRQLGARKLGHNLVA